MSLFPVRLGQASFLISIFADGDRIPCPSSSPSLPPAWLSSCICCAVSVDLWHRSQGPLLTAHLYLYCRDTAHGDGRREAGPCGHEQKKRDEQTKTEQNDAQGNKVSEWWMKQKNWSGRKGNNHPQPHLPILTSYFPQWKPRDPILWRYSPHTRTHAHTISPQSTTHFRSGCRSMADLMRYFKRVCDASVLPPTLHTRAGFPGAWRGSNVHQWVANYHAELSGTDGQPLTVLDGQTHTHTHTLCFIQEVRKPSILHTSDVFVTFKWIQLTSHNKCSANVYCIV